MPALVFWPLASRPRRPHRPPTAAFLERHGREEGHRRIRDEVTAEGSPDFVPAAERIAVFDNDGTLWSERPLPFQAVFALDRIKALAPQHRSGRSRSLSLLSLKGPQGGARGRRAAVLQS